jgi:hypothetical protein
MSVQYRNMLEQHFETNKRYFTTEEKEKKQVKKKSESFLCALCDE